MKSQGGARITPAQAGILWALRPRTALPDLVARANRFVAAGDGPRDGARHARPDAVAGGGSRARSVHHGAERADTARRTRVQQLQPPAVQPVDGRPDEPRVARRHEEGILAAGHAERRGDDCRRAGRSPVPGPADCVCETGISKHRRALARHRIRRRRSRRAVPVRLPGARGRWRPGRARVGDSSRRPARPAGPPARAGSAAGASGRRSVVGHRVVGTGDRAQQCTERGARRGAAIDGPVGARPERHAGPGREGAGAARARVGRAKPREQRGTASGTRPTRPGTVAGDNACGSDHADGSGLCRDSQSRRERFCRCPARGAFRRPSRST